MLSPYLIKDLFVEIPSSQGAVIAAGVDGLGGPRGELQPTDGARVGTVTHNTRIPTALL